MREYRSLVGVVTVVLWLTVGLAAADSKVTGSLTVAGTTITPSQVVGLHAIGGWQHEEVIEVYLLPDALDMEGVMTAVDPEDALRERIPADFAVLTFSPKGELQSVYAYLDDGAQNYGFNRGEVEGVQVGDERLGAHVFTRGTETIMKTPISFDLTFVVDVMPRRVPTGTLPADGGAPGAAYRAYVKGLQEGDKALLMTHADAATAKELAGTPDELLSYTLGSMKDMAPKEMTVTGGAEYGSYVILQVKGRDWSGDEVAGAVKMVKDGESWRVAEEKVEMQF